MSISQNLDRKFSVEFITNIDALKKKTSKSKKTCRAVVTFITERIAAENAYASRLSSLAKSGGASMTSGYSLPEYKNNEEETLQEALNALISLTMQESQLHSRHAEELTKKILRPLDDRRKFLSKYKLEWLSNFENIKKKLVSIKDNHMREQSKIDKLSKEIDQLKGKKKVLMKKIGISENDVLPPNRMSADLQKLEKQIQEKITTFHSISEKFEECKNNVIMGEEQYQTAVKKILSDIQETETQRIFTLQELLCEYNTLQCIFCKEQETLCTNAGKTYNQIDPIKDIQSFIRKKSQCGTTDAELFELYQVNAESMSLGQQSKTQEQQEEEQRLRKEKEYKRVFGENLQKEMIEYRNLRLKALQITRSFSLYPKSLFIKRLRLHSDINCEDDRSLGLMLYLFISLSLNCDNYALLAHKYSISPKDEAPNSPKTDTQIDSNQNEFLMTLQRTLKISEKENVEIRNIVAEVLKEHWVESNNPDWVYKILISVIKTKTKTSKWKFSQCEEENRIFIPIMSFAWAFVFWQIFQKVKYKEDDFEKESINIIQFSEFNLYMEYSELLFLLY